MATSREEFPNERFSNETMEADLVRVQLKIEASLKSLVSMRLSGLTGSGPTDSHVLLREAAGLLEQIYGSPLRRMDWTSDRLDPGRGKARTLALLGGILTRARQVQLLNDAAMGFCRGWLSVAPPPLDNYTPEGIREGVREPGELRIQA